jgi:hypothetical protein
MRVRLGAFLLPPVSGYRPGTPRPFMHPKPGFSWNELSVVQTELQRHWQDSQGRSSIGSVGTS